MAFAHIIGPFDLAAEEHSNLSGMFIAMRDEPYTDALRLFPSEVFSGISARNWSVVCCAYQAAVQSPCRAYIQTDLDLSLVRALPNAIPIEWRLAPSQEPGLEFFVSDLALWGNFLKTQTSTALDMVAVVGPALAIPSTGRGEPQGVRFEAKDLAIRAAGWDLEGYFAEEALLLVMSVFFLELADPFIFGRKPLVEAIKQRIEDKENVVELQCTPWDLASMHRTWESNG